jgi:hypothetical protein
MRWAQHMLCAHARVQVRPRVNFMHTHRHVTLFAPLRFSLTNAAANDYKRNTCLLLPFRFFLSPAPADCNSRSHRRLKQHRTVTPTVTPFDSSVFVCVMFWSFACTAAAHFRATARPLLFRTSSVARRLPKTASNEYSVSPSPCSPSSNDQRFAASTQRAELAPVADTDRHSHSCVRRMKEREKLTALREVS